MQNWKELLTVLILGAVLLCLGAAKLQTNSEAWKLLRCQHNLQKIYQAASKYQDEHNGAFQPVIVRSSPRWTYWYQFLLPYINDPIIFYCPSHPNAQAILDIDPGCSDLVPTVFDQRSVSYGMNYALSSSGPAKPGATPFTYNINAIADLSYTIYFGDCKIAPHSLRPTKWCWNEDYCPIHYGKAQFIFLDGHTELMNHENLGLVNSFDLWKQDVKRWKNWKE